MKVGTGLTSSNLREIPGEVKQANGLGYDYVSTSETSHTSFYPLLIAAEHSDNIGLATSVTIVFPRSPMIIAQEAWDIQKFSNGRFQLGMGSQVKGHIIRRFSTNWVPPVPRMREYILSLRAIWDSWQNGTKLDFQGDHYVFNLMTPFFNPGPIDNPNIPIFISAINPYMCRLAGELCDGIFIHGFTTRKYTEEVILPNIKLGASRTGRSLDDIEISGGGFICTGANEEQVAQSRETTRNRIAFYASTRTYKAVLDVHGWGDVCLKLNRMASEGQWQTMGKEISDDILDAFAVTGTYDEIVGKIKKRYLGIATNIGFSIPTNSQEDMERLRNMITSLKEES